MHYLFIHYQNYSLLLFGKMHVVNVKINCESQIRGMKRKWFTMLEFLEHFKTASKQFHKQFIDASKRTTDGD